MLEDLALHGQKTPKRFNEHTMPPKEPKPQATSLHELDLSKEVLENYNLAKAFLISVLALENDDYDYDDDDDEPRQRGAGGSPNQIAAVINSARTSLAEIIKMRNEIYSAERFQKLETAMIQAVKMMPEDARNHFLDEYEKIANNAK